MFFPFAVTYTKDIYNPASAYNDPSKILRQLQIDMAQLKATDFSSTQNTLHFKVPFWGVWRFDTLVGVSGGKISYNEEYHTIQFEFSLVRTAIISAIFVLAFTAYTKIPMMGLAWPLGLCVMLVRTHFRLYPLVSEFENKFNSNALESIPERRL